jgi:uncharacterized membrane protein
LHFLYLRQFILMSGGLQRLINFEHTNIYMKFRLLTGKLFKYFLQGLIILAPIAITVFAVTSLFIWVDGILPNLIHKLFPSLLGVDENGELKHIPGLGFIVVVVLVLLVGYISSSFVVGKLVDLFDSVLEKTPGIKFIYSTLKDFFEAFAGNKRKFDKSVLVSIDANDIWRIGFITREELTQFELQEYVAVYVPQSYGFAGNLFFVRKERVRILTDMSSADAMKFAISGGVTEIEEES